MANSANSGALRDRAANVDTDIVRCPSGKSRLSLLAGTALAVSAWPSAGLISQAALYSAAIAAALTYVTPVMADGGAGGGFLAFGGSGGRDSSTGAGQDG